MPNHCSTDLIIVGDYWRVQEVLDKHFTEDGSLDCNTVIPYPKEYAIGDKALDEWKIAYCGGRYHLLPEYEHIAPPRPKDGFNSGGYEWCINNWGTKWGTYDGIPPTIVHLQRNRAKAITSFFSAWRPAYPVFYTLAMMYPELEFREKSYEAGMGYKVYRWWKNGTLDRSVESDYRGNRGG